MNKMHMVERHAERHIKRNVELLIDWYVEHMFAMQAIVPVIVNETADGTHHEAFFQQLRSGKVGDALLPDVVSEMSMAKAAEFLSLLPAEHGGPIMLEREERWTVKQVVGELLNYQAVLLHFLNPDPTSPVPAHAASSDGLSKREATRTVIAAKLAQRLIDTASKCTNVRLPKAVPRTPVADLTATTVCVVSLSPPFPNPDCPTLSRHTGPCPESIITRTL